MFLETFIAWLALIGTTAPRPARFAGAPLIDGRVGAPNGCVAFTFDDGPNLRGTRPVLDALDAAGVRATFFVVATKFDGEYKTAPAQAELLREIAERGHLIGNHTYDHAD